VNVIDDVAGSFSFPRLPLLIRASAPSKPADYRPDGNVPRQRGDSK